jgi:hypothetical protein
MQQAMIVRMNGNRLGRRLATAGAGGGGGGGGVVGSDILFPPMWDKIVTRDLAVPSNIARRVDASHARICEAAARQTRSHASAGIQ